MATKTELLAENDAIRASLGKTDMLPRKGITRQAIVMSTKALKTHFTQGARGKVTKFKPASTTKTKPAKLTHKAKVRDRKIKSLNKTLEVAEERRKKRELEKAEQLGQRLQFRREIGNSQKAFDARQAIDDAEADVAEAAARGDKSTTGNATRGSILEQFEAMKHGPERTAFYNKHKRAILVAYDHRA